MKLENIINSSTIMAIGHEDERMQVLFKSGALYEYWPISLDEFEIIKISESVMKKLKEIVEGSEPKRNYKKL